VRYGILSDVHGNLPALQSVLKTCAKIKVDKLLFLGDAVGYGANPNQCASLIREEAAAFLAGNHDLGAVGMTNIRNFNPYALEALAWTARTLTPDNAHYLKERPMTVEIDDIFLVHASPCQPAEWHYIFHHQEASLNFSAFSQQVCFIGHSHLPCVFILYPDGSISLERAASLVLHDNARYIINVGSVGQPRDGDPRASLGVLDTDNGKYYLHRTIYEIKDAQASILCMGLPRFLAERLAIGR